MLLNYTIKVAILFFTFLPVFLFGQEVRFEHDEHYGFIKNKGQWRREVLFQKRFDGGKWWTMQGNFLFEFQDFSELRENHGKWDAPNDLSLIKKEFVFLNFVGSNKNMQVEQSNPSTFYYNYFLGNDSSKWASDVHMYSEVRMKDLYPGIDLHLIEQKTELKYEFHLQAQAKIDQIILEYKGHKEIRIGRKGELIVQSDLGQIIEEKPYSYQTINGKLIEVPCQFVLRGNQVGFEIKDYNPDFPLVIDPVLIFATYNGAGSDNFGMTATYGHDGTAYSAGMIYGNNFPIPDSLAFDISTSFIDPFEGGGITDVFITKYNETGTEMLWSAFIGGGNDADGTETVHSLICDEANNLYFFGITSSSDFPMVNAFKDTFSGGPIMNLAGGNGVYCGAGTDLYVAKVSANGHQLMGSTYMGGTENDGVNVNITGPQYAGLVHNYGDQFRGEIMLDADNNIFVASCTRSADFQIRNAFLPNLLGQQDGVLFKLKNDCSDLLISTFIGGTENDACYSVKIDSSGFIVFAGGTSSTAIDNFYTVGTVNEFYRGGESDGFIGKISPDGISSLKMTHIGTYAYDQVYFVEINENNEIFAYGQTLSGKFPVVNASFLNPNSTQFIMKLSSDLSVIDRSTVFGSGDSTQIDISPSAFLVDLCGNIYVSGWGRNILGTSPMSNMPVTADAFQFNPPNGFDFFLMVLKREFDQVLYGTYVGSVEAGEHVDGGTSRYDKNGIVYQSVCGGCRGVPTTFPTTPDAWSTTNQSANGCNNLIFKFDFKIIGNADFVASDTVSCSPFTITFQNNSDHAHEYIWDFGDGTTSTTEFNPTRTYVNPGEYDVILSIADTVCPVRDTMKVHLTIMPPLQHSVSNDTVLCVPGIASFTANSFGMADRFQWSSNAAFTDTLNANLADSTLSVFVTNPGTYYVRMENDECSVIDSVSVRILSTEIVIGTNCSNSPTIVTALDNSSFNFTYNWSPSGMISQQLSASSVEIQAGTSGYVYADITASNGCVFRDSVFIDPASIGTGGGLTASASETIVVTGTEVTLFASPDSLSSYQWSPSTGLSNPNGSQSQVVINETTTFIVQATEGNCTVFDTVTIYCYSNLCVQPDVYVPNAFSPNEKGKNEKFYVRGPHINEMLLRVYDRWGQLVFETTDYNIGWDGSFKGRKLDPDVYDYYLKVTCIGGHENIIKGNVTLLK